jgi:restriction system protein
MARYYKRRGYRRRQSNADGAFGIVVILGGIYLYSSWSKFTEDYPFAVPLLICAVIAIVLSILSLAAYKWWRDQQIYKAYTIANIDAMDGLEFEVYLADLLRRRGYSNVRLTERLDLGVDIIARKDGITWGIQAKCYSGLVKAAAVRQVYTALAHYKCDRAMVISNSTYSRPAQSLANSTKTVLVDREQLSKWIYESSKRETA